MSKLEETLKGFLDEIARNENNAIYIKRRNAELAKAAFDLEAQIAEEKKRAIHHGGCVSCVTDQSLCNDCRYREPNWNLANLRTSAEEKKPELRHGDYGIWKREKSSAEAPLEFIAIKLEDGLHWFSINHGNPAYTEGDCGIAGTNDLNDFILFGNIFDEIKALQKPLTEFEIEGSPFVHGADVHLMGKHLNIMDPEDSQLVQIPIERLSEFAMKIRQIDATQKRKEAKK